jgi:mannobiose 2-epimerase
MTPTGYREALAKELQSILQYWMAYTPDPRQGGFIGRVDENDRPDPTAPKGLVLNSRILWTFSAAYRHTGSGVYHHSGSGAYLSVARRAYEYLLARFLDREYGGAFWSLDASGNPLNTRKQIYGQAFCLYGLSEFYRAAREPAALEEAINLFRLIETHSFDHRRKGYYEAFTRDWQQPDDLRLSEKDANEQKSMNTQLHVLEAYSNLYKCWPDDLLRQRICDLLEVFERYIIGKNAANLGLFFTEDWEPRSATISYGHDIEASWLLQEAAETIGNKEQTQSHPLDAHPPDAQRTRSLALRIATAAAEGLDTDGGLWYEKDEDGLIAQKHWWPQAEAMVGFFNAWQISGDDIWWRRSVMSWNFVRQYLRAPGNKEWYWGVLADHTPMPGQDKAGFWKCPYHNSRACLEILRRLRECPAG